MSTHPIEPDPSLPWLRPTVITISTLLTTATINGIAQALALLP
ncbi:hypothetical protein [Marisediminicola senii]|nr:hypothetical protein [Marisediminicola senii]